MKDEKRRNEGRNEQKLPDGEVRITFPEISRRGIGGLRRRVQVRGNDGRLLWKGREGDRAVFFLAQPVRIVIETRGRGRYVAGTVHPGGRYGFYEEWIDTFRLVELDGKGAKESVQKK